MKHITLLLLALFLFTSCATQRENRQRKKANLFFMTHKPELAKLCSDEFPVLPVEIIPGETVTKIDTVRLPGETIDCPEPTPENPRPRVKCPDHQIIIRESLRVDTIKIESTAKIYYLNSKIEDLEKENKATHQDLSKVKEQLSKVKNTRNTFLWIILLIAAVGGLFTAFKLFK